jgi:type IV pilus assembly protein PilQ
MALNREPEARMIAIRIRQFVGIFLSLCLIGESGGAALSPIASSLDSTAATEDMASPAGASTSGSFESVGSPHQSALIMGGISLPRNPITMDFQEADIRDVLHLLAVKSGINIIYSQDVTGPISVHLDRVPFDQAFQTVLTLKTLVALPMGSRVIRVVSSTGLTTEQSQAATFTRVFRLNYADADAVKKPIDAIRSAAGRKGVSTVDSKTNSLIVTDTQEGLKEVEDLIPILDKKPQQVDIESKIVEVTLSNETQTGISWQYAGSTGSNDAYKIGGTQAISGATTIPGPGANGGGTNITTPVNPGTAINTVNQGTGVNLNTITQTGFSFLTQQGTYLLSAQLAALATESRVKVLSTPHVVTTNNEEAKIEVVNNIPYQVSTLSNGISQTSVQFIQAGVRLTVKPTVNADRRITLKIHPEVSNATGSALANLPPTVNTRDADTTVVLRDGETIAIGGLITESTTKATTGIPILMSIPLLGYLFKSTDDIKNRDELIVFLTPKIAAE